MFLWRSMNSLAAIVNRRLLEIFKFLARMSIFSKIGFSTDIAVFMFGILGIPFGIKNSITIGMQYVNGVDLQIHNAKPPQATIIKANSPVTPAVNR